MLTEAEFLADVAQPAKPAVPAADDQPDWLVLNNPRLRAVTLTALELTDGVPTVRLQAA